MNARPILVATIQHTGTWFLLNFLKQHPACSKPFMVHKLRYEDELYFEEPPDRPVVLLHQHFKNYETAEEDKTKNYNAYASPILLRALFSTYKTVIPLRDPLRSLVTRQARHPAMTHRYIVHGFTYAATIDVPTVMFMPLDLLQQSEPDRRVAALKQLLTHMGLPIKPYATRWGRRWPNVASTEKSVAAKRLRLEEYKKMYEARDLPALRAAGISAEIDLLQEHEAVIRPFLEHYGYDDLCWYS